MIDTLPDAPSPSDSETTFDAKAYALLTALNTMVSQINAATVAMNLNALTDTSASSVAIGTGSKSFTVSTGKSFLGGQYLVIADTAAPSTNSMFCQVTSYNSGTGALVVNCITVRGSGTKTAWLISPSLPGTDGTLAFATLGANAFTGVQNMAAGAAIASASTINLTTATGNIVHVTGTTQINTVTLGAGMWRQVIFDGALTLAHHATNNNLNANGANIVTVAGDRCWYYSDGSVVYGHYVRANGAANVAAFVPVRQTVLGGPQDSNGLASFGGSTGSTTVTASGTLIAAAANGYGGSGAVDRVGSITNPSWTGLSTNGTMYLYLDVGSDGTCTAGSTTLAPVYQWGGTYSTTSGQATFNIQDMIMKVGNGSSAVQTWRVFVGQVTVAASVVSAIVWYQLQGRYEGVWTATLPATSSVTSANHNMGVRPKTWNVLLENTTTEHGYAVGDQLLLDSIQSPAAASYLPHSLKATASALTLTTGSVPWQMLHSSTSAAVNLTVGNWKYKFLAERGW